MRLENTTITFQHLFEMLIQEICPLAVNHAQQQFLKTSHNSYHLITHPFTYEIWPQIIPIPNKVIVRDKAIQRLSDDIDVQRLSTHTKPNKFIFRSQSIDIDTDAGSLSF